MNHLFKEKREEKKQLIKMLVSYLEEWRGRDKVHRYSGISFSTAQVELLLKALRRNWRSPKGSK